MDHKETGWKDGTGCRSHPIANFAFSGVGPSGSRVLRFTVLHK